MCKVIATLGILAVLGFSSNASALVITGGPVYSLPGGGSCAWSGIPTTGTGAQLTCSGINLGAHSNIYIGIKNNTIINGASTDGTLGLGGEVFSFSSSAGSSITYISSTSITSACATGSCATGTDTVNSSMLIAVASGSATVVNTGGTPASNGNGAIERVFRINSGSITFDVDITASDPHYSGQLCDDVYDPTHTAAGGNCRTNVDVAFYYSDCGDGFVDSPEVCDLGGSNGASTTCCTSSCTFRTAGQVCRPSVGVCDLNDTCTGSSASCSADAKSTASCRSSAGVCDLQEFCNGVGNNCPADAKSSAVCRSSGGVCDLAESCDGVGNDCPADAKSSAVCRSSGGVCDVVESCDGVNNACPTDAKSTAECRAAAGVCDIAESCDGVNNACPSNSFEPNTTACGDPTDTECSNPDSCDGAGSCSANNETAGTSCGDDGQICTADECDGSGSCTHPPGNPGTECRAASAGQLCDEPEECDGLNAACPADLPKGAGITCRADGGECDVEEECDGVNFQCPSDGFEPSGTACTADSETCTLDICDGNNNCTHPAGNAGTECRASAGVCDAAEQCDGSNPTCPVDASQPNGAPCTDDGLFCDGAETCQGGSCTSAGDPCNVGICDEGADQCLAGCTAAPLSGCRTAAKSLLSVKDDVANSKDKLIFKWLKGVSTDKSEFADPTASTDYALCIYSGSSETLVMEANVPPSSTKWDEKTKGYKYKDPARVEDGISKILLKGSTDNNSKALVKGQGVSLPDDPTASNPALEFDLPVKAQLVNLDTEVCFEGNYDTPDIKKNESGKFKGKEQ